MDRSPSRASAGTPSLPDVSAIHLIDGIGRAGFAGIVLQALAPAVSAAYFTVYCQRPSTALTIPVHGAAGWPDVTLRCWEIYRDGPMHGDRALHDAAQRASTDAPAWSHLIVDRITDRRHRVDVYERHALLDRLSIVQRIDGDGWLAINLFRVAAQGHFDDRELHAVEAATPLLTAAVRRHVELVEPPADDRPARLDAPRAALQRLARGLSERELDVCARLALGMTYDGIASDLGIAVTSAKTYRNRAFGRLGIQFRAQLGPLCWR